MLRGITFHATVSTYGMRRRRPTVCALVSGGLDSAVLVHRLLGRGEVVVPLYVRCGLRWETAELYWLRRWLRRMSSPRLEPLLVAALPLAALYGPHWSVRGRRVPEARDPDAAVYLPGRNVFLGAIAGIVCARRRVPRIALGTLRGNPFGDATPRFFREYGRSLSAALGRGVRITAPLSGLRKAELIPGRGRAPLGLTFSCLAPSGRRHCGRCQKCAERRRAFADARVQDPTRYADAG